MFKEERLEKIIKMLDDNEYISVQKLSKDLFVSLPTIRRDLSELERQGCVIRNHGGAKRIQDGHSDTPFDFRKGIKQKEKRILCKSAASLIHDGDVIFIDCSSTLHFLPEYIKDKHSITVVTNSIQIAFAMEKSNIKTYLAGGEITEASESVTGSFTEYFVNQFNYDIAFFSSIGVNQNGYIVDCALSVVNILKSVIRNSKNKVYVCDGDKFNVSSPYNLVPVNEITTIITNTSIPANLNYLLKKCCIKTVTL